MDLRSSGSQRNLHPKVLVETPQLKGYSIDSFGFRRCQRHFGNYSHTGGRSFAFANSTSACTWCHIGEAEASNDFAKASIRFRPTWDAQWTCDGWHFRFCKRRFSSAIRSWSEIRVCAWRWWTSWSNAGSSLTSSIRTPSQVHHRAHHHPWRRCSNKRRSWWAPIQPRSPRRCTKRHRWRWILGALGEIGASWTKSSSFWRWPPFKLRRTNGLGAGLASSLICGLGAGEVGGLLPHGDPKHASAEAAEVQRAALSGGERMYPPQERSEGWWERSGIVHRVPGLSCTLGEPNEGIRSAKHPEGAEQGPLGGEVFHLEGVKSGEAGGESRRKRCPDASDAGAGGDGQQLATGTTSISDRDASKHTEDQEGDHGGASTEQRGAQAAREPTQADLTAVDGGDQTSKRGRSGEGAEAGEDDADDAAGARGDEAESSCAKSSPHGSGGGSSRIDLEEVPLRGRPRKVLSEEGRPSAQTMVWPRASLPSLWRREGWDCVRGGRGGLDPLRECRGQTMGIGAQLKQRGQEPWFKTERGYEEWSPQEGRWRQKEGELDPCTKQAVRVKVKLSAKKRHVYEWDEGKETSFSRKDRRLLKRSKEGHGWSRKERQDPCRRAVLTAKDERGRSSTRTPRKGGTSFDLQTGWDLADPAHRRQMWRKLKEEKPLVLIVCPPCTAFSPIQELNYICQTSTRANGHGAQSRAIPSAGGCGDEVAGGTRKICALRAPCTNQVVGRRVHQGARRDAQYEHNSVRSVPVWPERGWNRAEPEDHKMDDQHGGTDSLSEQEMQQAALPHATTRKQQNTSSTAAPQSTLQSHRARHLNTPQQRAQLYTWSLRLRGRWGDGRSSARACRRGWRPRIARRSPWRSRRDRRRQEGGPQSALRNLSGISERLESEVRWAAKEYRCDVCEAKAQPKAARPTTIPRSFQPNRVIGVDLFFVNPPGGGNQSLPVLNVVDWGTSYQSVELLTSKRPDAVWEAFNLQSHMAANFRTTWSPRLRCRKGIPRKLHTECLVHQIASKAPWQQGKTERHGAHFKALLEKSRSEVVVTEEEELQQLTMEVEQAKNRYSNRSGFDPVQRQIGQWPRLPTSILSDEAINPSLV